MKDVEDVTAQLAFIKCCIHWHDREYRKCRREATVFIELTMNKNIPEGERWKSVTGLYKAHCIRGRILFDIERFREAIRDFGAASSHYDFFSSSAVSSLFTADEGYPNYGIPILSVSEVVLYQGLAYMKSGEQDSAIATFKNKAFPKAFIEAGSEDPEQKTKAVHTLSSMATAYIEMRRYEDAILVLEKAMDIQKEAPKTERAELWYRKGCAHFAHGDDQDQKADFEKAVHDFTKALHLDQAEAKYYYNRSIALHRLGKIGEAKKDLAMSYYLNPSLPNTLSSEV